MRAYDFEYDSLRLSDFGMTLCSFDSLGVETISNGSEITFNTVSTLGGANHELTSAEFEDCITATFQICNNLCDNPTEMISLERSRDIMRWLNRKSFHKFRLIDFDGEYAGIYFESSFNVSKIEINGMIVGFELEMFTNRPHAMAEPVIVKLDAKADEVLNIYNKSDLEGFVYPNMEITIKKDGDLKIYNKMEDRTMVINNCVKDEVIKVEYPIISSSIASHKIQNDFNWVFFRLSSTFKEKLNEVSFSLPCSIELTYSPVVKVGI